MQRKEARKRRAAAAVPLQSSMAQHCERREAAQDINYLKFLLLASAAFITEDRH
jgi:hypothetical protein